MISCKKATELVSKSMDEKLSLKEEFELKLHLFICEFCEAFKNQVNLIRNAFKLAGKEGGDQESEQCICDTAAAKEKLKRKLDDHSA